MGDRLATINMDRKVEGCYAPFLGGAGCPSNTLSPGPRPTSYQVVSWSIQPFGHNRHGPKRGWGCCAPFGGGNWSPSNTLCPGPRPTTEPSGILIHPTVWPEYINVTDRQTDRQTHRTVPQNRANRRPKSGSEIGNSSVLFYVFKGLCGSKLGRQGIAAAHTGQLSLPGKHFKYYNASHEEVANFVKY